MKKYGIIGLMCIFALVAHGNGGKIEFTKALEYYNQQNYIEAVKWYRKAAEQGHAGAQRVLGDCYYSGDGVTQDYKEAVKWLSKAAEQGDKKAQEFLKDLL